MYTPWSIKLFPVFLLSAFISAFLWSSVSARSAELPAGNDRPDSISITSNKMTMKSAEDKIVFEGAVSIKKGDLVIQAERAEVFLTSPTVSGPSKPVSPLLMDSAVKGEREVTRIETSGQVGVQQGEKRAKAEKGVYDRTKETIVLTGNPEVWEKDYLVKGKVITLFIAENRSLVEKSHVILQSGEKGLHFKGK